MVQMNFLNKKKKEKKEEERKTHGRIFKSSP